VTDDPAPYESAALEYLQSGWSGVLPISGKFPPPKGYTGADAPWPSAADVMSWSMGPEGTRNIGLRLPPHVIGIDVDNYGGKSGVKTLVEAQGDWGPLPDTWITTSRYGLGDPHLCSGIRLFTVPPGMKWPGVLGPAVEIIQTRHRYAMVWPSIHPEGRQYEWITPDGIVTDGIVPHADDLPLLPEAWVQALTRGEAEADVNKVDLTDAAMRAWLDAMGGEGERCPAMEKATLRALADLAHGASRHDAAMRATHRLTLLRVEGHTGLTSALRDVVNGFTAALASERGRDAAGEWNRMLEGAVKIAAGRPPAVLDPCKLMGGANYRPPGWTAPPLVNARSNGASAVAAAPRLTVVPDPAVREPQAVAEPSPVPDPALDPTLALELHQQRARRQAKRILDAEEAPPLRTPPWVPTLADELALPDEDVSYRIAEVLPSGGNVLLTAQFKAGKTTLINHLAKCLADGQPLFGLLDVTRLSGRVSIFNYEVSRAQYRRWLRDVAPEHPERVALLNLRGYALPLIDVETTEWTVRWLAERETEVWVLDPFARAAMGSVTSENDNTEVGRLLEHLDVIKERAGVRELILPTHTGRAEFEEGQERARGATRLDDWADVRWFLTKDDEGQRFFRATGRDVEYDEKGLEYDEGTRQLQIVAGNRRQAREMRVRNAVYASILNTPDINLLDIRKAVRATLGKSDNKAVDEAIADLEGEKEIAVIRQGVGRPTLHRVSRRSPFGPVR
jgi:hypothetical protein